jgi:hypothetical protein
MNTDFLIIRENPSNLRHLRSIQIYDKSNLRILTITN